MANMLALLIPVILAAGVTMATPAADSSVPTTSNHAKFAADIYSKCAEEKPGNMIISPFSIEAALSFASQGAGPSTFKIMKTGLHLTGTKEAIANEFHTDFEKVTKTSIGDAVLSVANKVFVQQGHPIKESFRKVAVEKYYSEVEAVNFSESEKAAKTVNTWVEKQTHDKIKDLVSKDTFDADSRLFLVNAIYFKGPWEKKFKTEKNTNEDFWVTPTEAKKIEYMNQKNDFHYGYFAEYNCSALMMKYNNSDISFLIVLPNERDGLPALESQLKNIDLNALTNKMYKQEVTVKVPKFKIESEFELKDVLTKLNMGAIFENSADFSELLDTTEPLKVSKVIHKAFIEVNEEGAEAAAATGTAFKTRSGRRPSSFVVEYPFYYAIVQTSESTVSTLFSGRFVN